MAKILSEQQSHFKKGLIKKGAPLPGDPKWKFKESHIKNTEAKKAAVTMQIRDHSLAVRLIKVPRQTLIFGRRFRISPKTPKLR